MVKMKAATILAKYFNSNPENKKSLSEFQQELKALSPDEKRDLATLAAEAMGVELDA